MLGSIMDSACQVWQEFCGNQGNCWLYEKTDMGVKLCVWWLIVKVLSLTFNFAAQYFYKAPIDGEDSQGEHSNSNPELSEEMKTLTGDMGREYVMWNKELFSFWKKASLLKSLATSQSGMDASPSDFCWSGG